MPVVRGLAEVVLWVHDLPAALAFYRDLLGLPVISPPERANPIFLQAGPGTAGIPAMVVLVQLPPDAPPFSLPRPLHHLAGSRRPRHPHRPASCHPVAHHVRRRPGRQRGRIHLPG